MAVAQESAPLLKAFEVTKRFGETIALRDGSLEVEAGEIHGLLGQNGAGKSTLVKILAGVYQRDSGLVSIAGEELGPQIHPADVRRLGMSFIHQDLGLIEDASVAENMAFGLGFPRRRRLLDRAAMAEQAHLHLSTLGVDLDPERPVASLNGAEQALVAIARAIVDGARLMVLDEPTARLRGSEVEHLHAQLDQLRRRSLGFIYVTHRLDEVFALTDRVTVFRNGATITTRATGSMTEDELIEQIVGRRIARESRASASGRTGERHEVVLEVRGVATEELLGLDLVVHAGEVVGLAGPAGAGTSLARIISGAERPMAGEVLVGGSPGPSTVRDAVLRGVAYIPENRRRDGLSLAATISENLAVAHYVQSEDRDASSPRRWMRRVSPRREKVAAAGLIAQFGVRTSGPDALVSGLSGGNQQKVLIAKWLQEAPQLLVLDEPTQGVDVGTRSEIYDLVRRRAAEGLAVLVVSSDAQELASLCDRVAVVREGRIGVVLTGARLTQDDIAAETYRTTSTDDTYSETGSATA